MRSFAERLFYDLPAGRATLTRLCFSSGYFDKLTTSFFDFVVNHGQQLCRRGV